MTDTRSPRDTAADIIRSMQRAMLSTGCHTIGPCHRCGHSARAGDQCVDCHVADLAAIPGVGDAAAELKRSYEHGRWVHAEIFRRIAETNK